MKLPRVSILLLILLLACNEESIEVETSSGYFNLSQIKSSPNGRIASPSAEQTFLSEFDLGDLKASKEFYFLLSNGGRNPITDITLETDDPRFAISPKTISKLDGSGESNDFAPLISLGVVHGVQLNGYGFTDILEMGEKTVALTIKGKTQENGVAISIASEFLLKVNVKVMDIELSDNNSPIDLWAPDTYATGVIHAGGLALVPGYSVQSEAIGIKNTGNIEVKVEARLGSQSVPFAEVVIAPNQTRELTLSIPPYETALISVNGNGTITDYRKIKLGNDGKAHFLIE